MVIKFQLALLLGSSVATVKHRFHRAEPLMSASPWMEMVARLRVPLADIRTSVPSKLRGSDPNDAANQSH